MPRTTGPLGREQCGPGALKCPGAIEAKVVDHGVEIAAPIAPKERGVMHRLEPRLEAVRLRDASRGGPGTQQLVGGGAGPAGSLLPRGGVGQPPAMELNDLPPPWVMASRRVSTNGLRLQQKSPSCWAPVGLGSIAVRMTTIARPIIPRAMCARLRRHPSVPTVLQIHSR
jgi:hypothetical protein